MGFFNNSKSNHMVSLAKDYAHTNNEAGKEITDLLTNFVATSEKHISLSSDFGDFSEEIMEKLDLKQIETLTKFIERIYDFKNDFNQHYQSLIELSNNQNERTEVAIEKYGEIKGA